MNDGKSSLKRTKRSNCQSVCKFHQQGIHVAANCFAVSDYVNLTHPQTRPLKADQDLNGLDHVDAEANFPVG